ncbi:MAG TPA: amino acid ABC transporter substrate-binding protein, partial [Candidatus Atribacteria bacterium]|nr:amino acid ABC transporter substrate-binding protein [Candidatus Atribacteria bacterium]
MKRFLSVLFLVVFVFSTYALAGELYFGLSAPLTGDYAQYGEVFKKGVELALEEFNEKGGFNGIKVKLIALDSKGDPKEAANIAQKFVMDKRIIAEIGDFTSTCCLAAAPIYQRAGLVQLSPTSSHPDFTKQGDYMFRNIITQEAEGPYIAKYAYEDLGKKSVAVVYIQNDWGIVAKDNFVKGFKELGGKVLLEQKFNPGTKDYTNIITKIKARNPDIIYIAMMYTEAALFAKQMKKLGVDIPLIGTGALYSPKLIELGGEAVEGLYCTSSFYPYSDNPII